MKLVYRHYMPTIGLVLSILITGCSSPNKVIADNNFKDVIETTLNHSYYAGNCINFYLNNRTADAFQTDTLLQALIAQGYIKAKKVNDLGLMKDPAAPSIPGYLLTITDKGMPYFRSDYFCFGNVTVTKIDNYSIDTAPGTGQKTATVIFDYQVNGKPQWLKPGLVTWMGVGTENVTYQLNYQNQKINLLHNQKGWYHE